MKNETQTWNASSSLIEGEAMYITKTFLEFGTTLDRKHNAKKTVTAMGPPPVMLPHNAQQDGSQRPININLQCPRNFSASKSFS